MSLKKELNQLLACGSADAIDGLLEMPASDPMADLNTTFAAMPTSSLGKLDRAVRQKRLMRRRYHDESTGRGCLMYWLIGATSNRELQGYFPDEGHLAAACRVVRFFDRGKYTDAEVKKLVAQHIAIRKEVNELEDDAVKRAEKRASRQPARVG